MSEISHDPTRKVVKTKSGLEFMGYKSRRELAKDNIIDGLTGLLNRKGWDKKIAENGRRAERTGENTCFLVIDLDKFKEINDLDGHKAGDKKLENFAKFLKSEERESDIIARYGGDEYTICMPGTSLTEAQRVKERIITSGKKTGIEFSIGVGETFVEADEAMYEMKNKKKHV